MKGGLSLLYDWTESACICGCMMEPFFNECAWALVASRWMVVVEPAYGGVACLTAAGARARTEISTRTETVR